MPSEAPSEAPKIEGANKPTRWVICLHLWLGILSASFGQVAIGELGIGIGALPTVFIALAGIYCSKIIVSSIWKKFRQKRQRILFCLSLVILYPALIVGGGSGLLAALN